MSTDIDGGFDFISANIDADVALPDLQPSDSDTTLRSSEAQETAILEAQITALGEIKQLEERYHEFGEGQFEWGVPTIRIVKRIQELQAENKALNQVIAVCKSAKATPTETAILKARKDEAYLLKRRYVDIEVDEEVYIPAIEKVFVDRIAELKAQLSKEKGNVR